jgi:MtN3 and saliva related transmembrane protein
MIQDAPARKGLQREGKGMRLCMIALESYAVLRAALRDTSADHLEFTNMVEIIGLVAAILTTLSFLPQTLMVMRSGQTSGISLTMYAMFTTGVAGWLVYGILQASLPIILANAVTLMFATIILLLKVRSVVKSRPRGLPAIV